MAIPTRFWLWSSFSNKSAPNPSKVYVLDVASLSGSKVNTLYKFNAATHNMEYFLKVPQTIVHIKTNEISVDAGNDITMLIPNLIDAYKEKQSIFVFLYKDRSAMLQNYTFNEEKKTFKIKEYPLIAIGGGSVMNFGVYNMGVQKIILDDDVAFAEVAASRQVLGGGGLKFLMIEKGEVRELKFKDNYKTVRFKSPISSFGKEYLSKEIKNQFVKHKLLKEKDRFVYYGYLKDNLAANVRGDGNIYLFYKDENNPLSYQVIKYDISTKEWLINGYQEWRVHSTEDKSW